MMTTISHRKVAKLMSQYNDQNSDAEMEVTEMSWPDLQKVLEDDKFDLVIMNLAGLLMDAFTSRQLCSEKYVVLLPRDHPLTRFDTLRLDQLSGQNYVDRLACEMRQRFCKPESPLGLSSMQIFGLSGKIGCNPCSRRVSALPLFLNTLFWLKMLSQYRSVKTSLEKNGFAVLTCCN